MKQVVRTFLRNNEGKYLMVQHKGKSYWSLPGGHLEDGESIYKAIKREIKEELNLKIKLIGEKKGLDIESLKEKVNPLSIYKIKFCELNGKEIKRLEYIFLSEIKSGTMEVQESEIGAYNFFSLDEIIDTISTHKQVKQLATFLNK